MALLTYVLTFFFISDGLGKDQLVFESRLVHHRFSQKTDGRICFVCFFTLHGAAHKSNSSVRFLGESMAR